MFKDYRLTLVNNHLVIEDGQHLVVDTGSTISFHSSGHIEFGGETVAVRTSIPMVPHAYLKEKVGADIEGLLGMDIINQHYVEFSMKDSLLFSGVENDCSFFPRFKSPENNHLLGGLIGISVFVNGRKANLLVDSGAQLSYIHPSYVSGFEPVEVKNDFSPFIGDFQTPIYTCVLESERPRLSFLQNMGILPDVIQQYVSRLGIDGIIGVDFFIEYRFLMKEGYIYFLPQGI